MDRLLTGDEIEALDGRQNMVATYEDKVVAKTQDAKSIKADRQAAAEWLEQNYGLVSMAWLVEILRTNKVPWGGEQDAIHTTRKTPRTIPPD